MNVNVNVPNGEQGTLNSPPPTLNAALPPGWDERLYDRLMRQISGDRHNRAGHLAQVLGVERRALIAACREHDWFEVRTLRGGYTIGVRMVGGSKSGEPGAES